MADEVATINKIKIDNTEYALDATTLGGSAASVFQTTGNITQSITSKSKDTEYPSAECVYNLLGDIESILAAI